MRNLLGGKAVLSVVVAAGVALLFALLMYNHYGRAKPAIKIGVLHSLTGALASNEMPLVDALRLAVEEANQEGGVNGAQIEMVVSDCRSDAAYCAQQAEKLITQDGVQALFGCGTSACRKAVKLVVEKHHHLLFYPLRYEGMEQSQDILYTGATLNQQIIPMVSWALQHRGKRAWLIGPDDVFSRTTHQIIKKLLLAKDGMLVAEHYVPLVKHNLDAIVDDIARQRPDFVVNMLNGDSNRRFFQALRKAGIRAENIPVFSTGIAEAELAAIGPELVAGHYAARNYFQGIYSVDNRAFIERFRRRFGQQRVLDEPMEGSYIGMQMLVNALRSAGTTDMFTVKTFLMQQTLAAPEGIVAVDAGTRHLWKHVRIGKARADGQFDIVWQSELSIAPAPFPFFVPHAELRAMEKGRP